MSLNDLFWGITAHFWGKLSLFGDNWFCLALLFLFIESSMILQSSRAKQKEVTSKDFCATLRSKAKTLQASTGRVATYETVLEWCGMLAAEAPLQQN